MRTIYDLLILVFLFVLLIVTIDKPTNYEMDQAWSEMATTRTQAEHARLLANQAYHKAERCQQEQRSRDDYPWLREWFVLQAGRDPFMRMR